MSAIDKLEILLEWMGDVELNEVNSVERWQSFCRRHFTGTYEELDQVLDDLYEYAREDEDNPDEALDQVLALQEYNAKLSGNI